MSAIPPPPDQSYWDGLDIHTEEMADQGDFPQNRDRWGNYIPDEAWE